MIYLYIVYLPENRRICGGQDMRRKDREITDFNEIKYIRKGNGGYA